VQLASIILAATIFLATASGSRGDGQGSLGTPAASALDLGPRPPDCAATQSKAIQEKLSLFAVSVRGCRAGDARACRRLAQRAQLTRIFAEGSYSPVLYDACQRGIAAACSDVAASALSGENGAQKNVARGLAILERACERGDDISCGRIGHIWAFGRFGQ
jgi:hypothetical protein